MVNEFYKRTLYCIKIIASLLNFNSLKKISISLLISQVKMIGPDSVSVTIITAFFIGMVLSLQVVKEFLYLNAIHLIGSVLTIAFLRELSPVLTIVIAIGRICSAFTAELGTMIITEQIDAFYLLGINPIIYLVIPRIISFVMMLPILNIFSIVTSLTSSAFICLLFYDIDPRIFWLSSYRVLSVVDILKSSIKIIILGILVSIISCAWGLATHGSTKNIGLAITSSVVTCLLCLFIVDFILSYFMFSTFSSTFQFV
uniref:ABC transporter permease n=1 Tax=Callithamnion tetricum TaxID=193179 RepID=A0A4D6WM03_9FLOR|nr:hypothetical protein [Callithamnion tetricum]